MAERIAKRFRESNQQHISLQPLRGEDIIEFLADSLGRETAELSPLARLVHQHSKGNPFVARQLVQRMHSDGLLTFDEAHRNWVWDLEEIASSSQAGDIVEIVAGDIGRLSEESQELLQLAACMGSTIDVATLARVSKRPVDEVDSMLSLIAEALFIQPSAAHQTAILDNGEFAVFVPQYAFRHDRIQQAAYSLVPDDQRAATHLRIGRLLIGLLEDRANAGSLIRATEQLNAGRALLDNALERQRLAELNLSASARARSSTSWPDAKRFIVIADQLLDESTTEQALLYEVRKEHAFVEFLNGEADAVRELIKATLPLVNDPFQRATLICQLVVLDTASGDNAAAIAHGRRALNELGISLPKTGLTKAFEEELRRATHLQAERSFEMLASAPVMTDPVNKLAVRILVELDSPAFLSDLDLYAVVVSKMVSLSFEHGPVPESSKAYASFGIVLGPKLGRYEEALHFNQLGIAISERFADKGQECRACHTMANHILSWRLPVREANDFNDRGYQAGYQAGEILWCGYIRTFNVYNRFFEGRSLGATLEDTRMGIEFCESTGNRFGLDALEGMRLVLRTLSGKTTRVEHDAIVAQCKQNSTVLALGLYLGVRAEAELVGGRPSRALELCDEAQQYLPHLLGFVVVVGLNLVESLASLALLRDADEMKRCELLSRVEENQKELRGWTDSCPANFECRWLLVEAERAKANGELLRASGLFDQSTALAEAEGFVQIEALNHERQAQLWSAANKAEVANVYQGLAQRSYERWGAKVVNFSQHDSSSAAAGELVENSIGGLDLEALMKASRSLSGELQRDRLPKTILKLMVLVSGAEWGHLILDGKDGLCVEATVGPSEFSEASMLLADQTGLAEGVVRFVFRTGEETVLTEACSEGPFVNDPCVSRRQIRSLLALPLILQGENRGVLYLTNELVAGAFGEDRVDVLRMLLAQAAVSLANSELFKQVESQAEVLLDQQRRQTELAEAKLDELSQQLVQQTRFATIGQWTASIAHEIRNPLGAVRNAAYLLKQQFAHKDQEAVHYLEMIDQEVETVAQVIRSMLEMVQSKDPVKTNFDLSSMILEVFERTGKPVDIQLDFVARPDPFFIHADQGMLRQVITNLIANAIQAVKKEGVIRVEAIRDAEHNRISVQDNGPGIDVEHQKQLFDPLFTTKAKGTGLGLAICQEIIKRHGGTIQLQEHAGGALFCILLPRDQ